MSITIGERYRRRSAPRDYVWPLSVGYGSVGYRRSDGALLSTPVEDFEHAFELAPRRSRKAGRS